jgi:ABC-type histidine transport system ATPase subunit
VARRDSPQVNHSRILEQGTPDDMINRPREQRTKAFLSVLADTT